MEFPDLRVLKDRRVTKASTDIRAHTALLELQGTKANLAAAACHVSLVRRERRESAVWTERRVKSELGAK